MRFIRMIREAYFLWQRENRWRKARKPLLALALGKYTYSECLLAVAARNIESEQIGPVALLLHCRCGRGSMSLARR